MTRITSPTALDRPLAWDTAMPEADSDDLIGVTLHDTYEIRAVLGEGGMGKVYEAHHTRIRGKRFAIKVLRTEMAHSPEVRTRFQREADAAASINHPNVIAVNDFGYAPDGRPYIVYDHLQGLALSDLITDCKHIELGIAVFIGRQVCRALQAAHDKGVIHRDLKPDNIYLLGPTERPDVKVLDFGLSRFMASTTRNAVTRAGVVMGTPSYMAPEQARAEATDHRCDIYGVGVLLYAALTGRPPFDEDTPAETVLAVMTQPPTPPRVHAPWIPEQLESVILRAMARDPAERYQTMAELDVALSPFDVLTKREPRIERIHASGEPADVEEMDVGRARRGVILRLVLAFALLSLGIASALSGASSSMEFAVTCAALVGALSIAFVMGWLRLRRELWNDRARMSALVSRLRAPLVASMVVYGVLVLLGRALDAIGMQFSLPLVAPSLSGWMGWGPILFGIGLLAATAAFVRGLLSESERKISRLVGGPIVFGIAIVGAVLLLHMGLRSRAPLPQGTRPAASLASSSLPDEASPHGVSAAQQDRSNPAFTRAPTELIASARQNGFDALVELREKYPRDPAVLEPLALAYAQRSDGALPALETLDALFSVAPAKIADKQLATIVTKAALGPADVSARALDLMAQRMGQQGADQLYDLYVRTPALRVAARARLDDPRVRERFTPALGVAYDLRKAEGCAEKSKLLGRAAQVGDDRSLIILQLLSNPTKKGCGYKNRKPCPPPCAEQASEFKRTEESIRKRLATEAQARR